jgi:hypothetical protein
MAAASGGRRRSSREEKTPRTRSGHEARAEPTTDSRRPATVPWRSGGRGQPVPPDLLHTPRTRIRDPGSSGAPSRGIRTRSPGTEHVLPPATSTTRPSLASALAPDGRPPSASSRVEPGIRSRKAPYATTTAPSSTRAVHAEEAARPALSPRASPVPARRPNETHMLTGSPARRDPRYPMTRQTRQIAPARTAGGPCDGLRAASARPAKSPAANVAAASARAAGGVRVRAPVDER